MKKRAILGIVILFGVAACDHVYREYDKDSFSTMSWKDGQTVTFTPVIEDTGKPCRIELGIRHHYGLNVEKFGVQVLVTSPSGKEERLALAVVVKDPSGERIGDCMGDICDLETAIADDYKFAEAGTYTVSVSHTEHGYQIPGIMEVGLIIDEKE